VRGLAAAGARRRALTVPRLVRQPVVAAPPAGGSPFTLYPSAQSGYLSSSNAAYATARAGSSLGANVGATPYVGQGYYAGDYHTPAGYDLYEAFIDFDTSGVTGTIATATLSLGLSADNSSTDFTVEARVRDWGSTLTTADWVAGADLASLTLAATLATNGIGAAGAYKAMTEVGTSLRGAINQAGITRFVLASDRTRLSTDPSGDEFVAFEAYNQTLKAKLVVTTT